MILQYEAFTLHDEAKENDITAEVNWDTTDQKTKDSQVVRMTFPDGKQAFINRDELNFLLFAIGKEEDQRKMIPQKLQPVHHWEKTLQLKAKTDIPKGGDIVVKVHGSIPCLLTKEIIGDAAFGEEVRREMTKKNAKKIFMSSK